MSAQLKNIAILIDADNASAKNIGHILQEIEKLGHITCKKIYGDWGNAHIQSWQEALLKYAIDPMQQFAYVKGKNATDIGMVIEAMDLLYSNNYDGFCLISSDSDFTSLALRIRKNHVKVFGFGKRNTVSAFSQACDKFFYVEDLLVDQNNSNSTQTTLSPKRAPNNNSSKQWTTKQLQTQTHLINLLNKIIKENINAHNGWSNLSYIASELSKNHNDIKLDKYGYDKFSNLMIALRLYDIRKQSNGMWAKIKIQKALTAATTANKKTIDTKPTSNLFPAASILVKISTAPTIDAVLFRVTPTAKVRGDEDMIFYGQTHSEDGSIELNQQLESNTSVSEFSCDLNHQPTSIEQLNFVLSSELESLAIDPQQTSIKLNITDEQQNTLLFSGKFDVQNKSGKSLILFTLNRTGNQWQFVPKHQNIDGDLRYLCEKYGVELSDN
ncbi:NYN domain-containing protein [Psychrobacter sp. SCQQ22]|uniref:NYN domain-containing protein n=1 Tax=Psychrobacter sp. SCQQ22 TaxID=2792059 RepID=UPI0018CE7F02|nr:NYN domain-containing protein [Psychrobacter sp. SCQQ22]MBH0086378.1 NYN domain-containing protein [Psychrobacter sp. SCQQ22]